MIPVGIVTTARRASTLALTLRSLNDPDLLVFTDLKPGAVENHVASWQKLFSLADRAILLQDDISAGPQWRQAMELVIRRRPVDVISFYHNRAVQVGAPLWSLPGSDWLNEQALMLTKPVYEQFVDWLRLQTLSEREQTINHDWLLSRFFKVIHMRVWLTNPPIVQHQNAPSTLGHSGSVGGLQRRSRFYRGDDFNTYEFFRRVLPE